MPIITEYIWIDAKGGLRSKSRVFEKIALTDLPKWNFDGSSTGQAESNDSEVILKPCRLFIDPLKRNLPKDIKAYLVLCECEDKNGLPLKSNTRRPARDIFDKVKHLESQFGIEQEYVLYNNTTNRLVGWPAMGFPEPQGKYYCGVGADRSSARSMVEEHYLKCLEAGVKICGINEEVLPGQWEFQIGICDDIEAADHLVMARYLLHRIGESYNIRVSFEPKPIHGDWNGSGCHTNYSTKEMRSPSTGIKAINAAIERLGTKHAEHLAVYGDNSQRLSGTHETSSRDKFTFGIGDRTASIRIPTAVQRDGCGYIEDRRPASDCDPYLVTSMIAQTTLL